jgi:hypothetical protein
MKHLIEEREVSENNMSLPDLGKIKYTKPRRLDIQIDNFKGGVNTLVSAPRLKINEAVQAKNLMLVEDGLWTKRWGTDYFGTDAGGSIVDGFAEYRTSAGTRELIIFANGLARKTTDNGENWTTISGYTPTANNPVCAVQIGNYLYACNGVDSLARYNGTSFSTYTEIDPPENLSATRNTLSAGDYNYYYEVTAHNEVGETIASDEATEDVDKDRDAWTGDDAIDLTWDVVDGAKYYTVYMGTSSGYCEKLIDVNTNSYSDDGSIAANPYIESPSDNTTGGPLFKTLFVSGNRLWGVDDPDNPWTVYFSGKGNRVGIFSFAYGGGWIELEKGGKAVVKGGIDFQNNPVVFCPTPDGRGAIWQISLEFNDTYNFWNPTATKITNQISSVSPRSIIQAENDVFFATRKGVYILGNEPNITAPVLRTNEISAKIRDYIAGFSESDIENICAYYKDGRVFFSTPDRIFYYDRERLAWVKDWTTGVSQFGEHTDSDGNIYFLGGMSTDGYLIKFSENIDGDLGEAFETVYLSPRLPVAKDWTKFAKIENSYIRLRNPRGSISFTILGTEKGKSFLSLLSKTYTPGVSTTGWNWDKWNTFKWNTSSGSPSTFASESDIRKMRIYKRLRDIQFKVSTTSFMAKYIMLGLKATGQMIETSEPSDWKLD